MNLEKMIEQLNDNELRDCYFEYVKWRKVGTPPEDALIRKLWNQFRDLQPTYPIHAMNEPILFEIAKRRYEPKFAAIGDNIEIIGNINAHDFEIGQTVRVVEWNHFNEEDDGEAGVEASDGKEAWFIRHEDYKVIR